MSALPDTLYCEVFAVGELAGVTVSRNQLTGTITFLAGDGIKQLLSDLNGATRESLHARLDRFLDDELTK